MAPGSVTRCCRARAALGRNAQERPVTQAARPQTRPAAARTVAVAAGDTLESLARQPDRATLAPGRTSHRPQRARAELERADRAHPRASACCACNAHAALKASAARVGQAAGLGADRGERQKAGAAGDNSACSKPQAFR